MKANIARMKVDCVRDPVRHHLPMPTTEFGFRTGEWGNENDWCIWLAGYGVHPVTVTTKTIAGDRHEPGFEVVEAIPVDSGPMDLEIEPEPRIEPLAEFLSFDRAVAFMLGRAMADRALQWLARADNPDPLKDIPAFLRRQAD